jgi:2-polyprenyl-3-methyl-5-hydroxy-6-metoxy-1,4-benzoquinol methylase
MSGLHKCGICGAKKIKILNSYKHNVLICFECSGVCHFKKDKYAIEKIFPRQLAKRLLPKKAFLRLFSDNGDFEPSDFYDSGSFSSTENIGWRLSEVEQFQDQLDLINYTPKGKKILDISGGPGNIGSYLRDQGADVYVTEYSQNEVDAMQRLKNINAIKFDYSRDRIQTLFEQKFDFIMVRSSIIFCEDLEAFFNGLDEILNPGGVIMIETILPTMGEILWWQQLEYKFPRIFSSKTITQLLENYGYKSFLGYRETGSYLGVKFRSYRTLARQLFTWLVDWPMVLYYYIINREKALSIDKSLNHVMETTFWSKADVSTARYYDIQQGGVHKSKTFGYRYNGYLKNLN